MQYVLLGLIATANLIFIFALVRDLYKKRATFLKEPGNTIAQSISSTIIYFFSTFGISDFAISTVLYRKMKWVSDRRLPGTLNTQCVIPVAVMAFAYISSVEVGIRTLLALVIAQAVGAYIGPRYVVRLPVNAIRLFIATGLVIASLVITASQLGWIPSDGTITELPLPKLIIAIILMFIYGALNNVGIGSYALTMVTIYALGMNPVAAFPIMMGACAVSVPIGATEFVRLDSYSAKLTFISAIFGVIGVLCAVFLVTSLPLYWIKWLVVAVLVYSSITMFIAYAENNTSTKEKSSSKDKVMK
ncbi:sulfite exporter TauE/SafE family protein [Actinomycetaceae bacterium TAE3-ERU4]|nr:sulfite exporter TauE/SafE family protein [Actinomycetaceae bacterium TAE3-ERU4]